ALCELFRQSFNFMMLLPSRIGTVDVELVDYLKCVGPLALQGGGKLSLNIVAAIKTMKIVSQWCDNLVCRYFCWRAWLTLRHVAPPLSPPNVASLSAARWTT